jgi:[ribosomal protein S5]-alanine N-acetyltransferase
LTVTETARLRLRELEAGDAPFILELLTDPDFRANVGDRGVHDLESARRYTAESAGASYRTHGFGLWLIERKADGRPLGLCGLLRRDSHPDTELGFALAAHARGQGYALEAAAATLRVARARFGLERLVAITAAANTASSRLLERLAFRFAGMVRFTADGESRLFVRDGAGGRDDPADAAPAGDLRAPDSLTKVRE